MNNEDFVVPKKASQILGVHYQTLRAWDAKGKIETIRMDGGKRLYNVKKYIRDNNLQEEAEIIRHNICYCRVSSASQKDDLERQVAFMKNKYPNHEIMTDIGSGINFKRKNLIKIINLAINNHIEEIVIAYKDRLCRFGYELIEMIINEHSKGRITVLNNQDDSPQEELTKDLVSIINIFSAKLNGVRSYKTT